MNRTVNTKFRRYLSLLLVVMLLVSVIPASAAADGVDAKYLLFTSDTHNVPAGNLYANKTAERLGPWITSVSETLGGVQFDTMGFCGDMGSAIDGTAGYWTAARNVMDAAENNSAVGRVVYTYGNHDSGVPGSGKDPMEDYYYCTSKMTQCGGCHYDGYSIFCIGVRENCYQSFDSSDIAVMSDFLKGCPADEPVFIVSHYPLHSTATRPIYNGGTVISMLNNYPNVVFLWGHNHTEVDPHYGNVYTGRLDNTPIKFTYASAGAMVDKDYGEPQSAQILSKGLAVRINSDDTLTFMYFDLNGKMLSSTNVSSGDTEPAAIRQTLFTRITRSLLKNSLVQQIMSKLSDTFLGGGDINSFLQDVRASVNDYIKGLIPIKAC